MKRFCGLMILAVSAMMLAGCMQSASSPMVRTYGPSNPGPWQNVNVMINWTGDRITVDVKDFPTSPKNYVRKLNLVDQRGVNVGERIFAIDNTPTETFVLSENSKQVVVSVISTGWGQWQSAPVSRPPAPPKNESVAPPK